MDNKSHDELVELCTLQVEQISNLERAVSEGQARIGGLIMEKAKAEAHAFALSNLHVANSVADAAVGEPAQEVGGVMVTLAALCLANGLDMHAAGETELARIWTKVEAIRAKQAAKPKHSPLPAAAPATHPQVSAALDELLPCPFCAATPLMQEHEPHSHSIGLGLPDHPGSFTIECPTDGCCGMIASAKAEAVAAWNRRAALASTAVQVAAVPEARAEAKRCQGEPDESFYRRVVFNNGWNECREAMLAAAPSPALPAGGGYAALLLNDAAIVKNALRRARYWVQGYEREQAIQTAIEAFGRIAAQPCPAQGGALSQQATGEPLHCTVPFEHAAQISTRQSYIAGFRAAEGPAHQQGRAAGIEEAAKVAEQTVEYIAELSGHGKIYATNSAAAIRALAAKKEGA